jgi:uncharacterized protein (DUF2164 family)
MSSPFSKDQKREILSSLQRYFVENLDRDLSEMEAGFLLDYVLSEIAPFAYNQGVEDARRYVATVTEDLPGTCFQEALTYWKAQKGTSRAVRRKPDAGA